MSAGKFQRTLYASDNTGQVHPVRVQPETLTLTIDGVGNAPPAGPATNRVPARVSGSRRMRGLSCRQVRFQFNAGAAPSGYADLGVLTLPWLDGSTFGAIVAGASVTYLGAAGEVVGKTPEFLR